MNTHRGMQRPPAARRGREPHRTAYQAGHVRSACSSAPLGGQQRRPDVSDVSQRAHEHDAGADQARERAERCAKESSRGRRVDERVLRGWSKEPLEAQFDAAELPDSAVPIGCVDVDVAVPLGDRSHRRQTISTSQMQGVERGTDRWRHARDKQTGPRRRGEGYEPKKPREDEEEKSVCRAGRPVLLALLPVVHSVVVVSRALAGRDEAPAHLALLLRRHRQ